MAKVTQLEKQWGELMFMCEQEALYRKRGTHSKLQRLVGARIDELAAQMGFGPRQIRTREFRAERRGDRIVQIVKGT